MAKDLKDLSANVLDMKFMRRTKQRIEEKEKRKAEAALQKAYLAGEVSASQANTPSAIPGCSRDEYIFTRDLEFLEDLSFGRMSFKGCNPEVERLMKYYVDKKNGVQEDDSDCDKDVDDAEMAETMGGSLSKTIAEKFNRREKDSLIDESNGDGMGPRKRFASRGSERGGFESKKKRVNQS